MRGWWALALCAWAGCATDGGTVWKTGSSQLMPETARQMVTAVLDAQLAALEQGDADGWARAFMGDALTLGARPDERLASRDAAIAAMRARLSGRPTVRSSARQIGISPDGRAAWTSEVIALAAGAPDRGVDGGADGGLAAADGAREGLRVTEVLAEQDRRWWVLAVHLSYARPADRVRALATQHLLAPLPDLGEQVMPGAQPIATELARTIAGAAAFAASTSERADAFMFGSAPDQQLTGGAAIRQAMAVELGRCTLERRGGLRAGVAWDGRVGWVAANLDRVCGEGTARVSEPERMLAVYLNQAGRWRLVQAHLSTPVPSAP